MDVRVEVGVEKGLGIEIGVVIKVGVGVEVGVVVKVRGWGLGEVVEVGVEE